MNPEELLYWLRGTGLQIAASVFVLGMIYRVLYPLLLGRKKNLAEPRGTEWGPGLRTIWRRSYALPELSPRGKLTVIAGYIFHLGFFITLFFLSQHIVMFRGILGFGWLALPRSVIDISAILALAALVALLVHRFMDPVKRMLSGFEDYLSWLLTFLPLLTGFMLLRQIGFDYIYLLIMHISSIELLLIAIPFTKLAHMLTTFSARWYNGAMAGYKGVKA